MQHNRQLLTVKMCLRLASKNFSKLSMFLEFFACTCIIIIDLFINVKIIMFSYVVLASDLFMYIHRYYTHRYYTYGTGVEAYHVST